MIINIPPKYNIGLEPFAYWENFLTKEDINKIISLPQWKKLNLAEIGGDKGNAAINKDIRRTEISWMDLNPKTEEIWKKIMDIISEVNRRFFQFELTGCYEMAQLGLYTSKHKDHYDWHTDACVRDNGVPRKLSMVLSLSDADEFEGGELQIRIGKNIETLSIKKGRAWFFPSYVLHRVTPVTKGIRKSLVIWIGGYPFK